MSEQEQGLPLAPACALPVKDGAAAGKSPEKSGGLRNLTICLVCAAVTFLVLLVTVLILAFTVFRVKDPIIKMNGVTITRLDVSLGQQFLQPSINMSLIADMSIKNPNAASFKYGNTTTEVYYRGRDVGEARGPPGEARARRTVTMNVTMDIMADRLLSAPGLVQDVVSGTVSISTFTRVGGRVSVLGIIKKHATVKMNCTISVDLTRRAVKDFKCKRKVDL